MTFTDPEYSMKLERIAKALESIVFVLERKENIERRKKSRDDGKIFKVSGDE